MIKKSNILITGGAGYIGSHIAEKLEKTKSKVIIYDNLITCNRRLINKRAIFIKGDIKNKKLLSNTIKKYNINTVIHLAAYLNVSEAEKHKKKYIVNNINGTLNLIKCCSVSSVKYFIFLLGR